MAKNIYVGVSDVARKVSKAYVGVSGTARKIIKGYVGVNGVAQLFYSPSNAFTSSPIPRTWTAVLSGHYKGTNSYGEWECYMSESAYSSNYAYNSFDGDTSTMTRASDMGVTNKIYLNLPTGVTICPTKLSIVLGTRVSSGAKFEGGYTQTTFPFSDVWETLYTTTTATGSTSTTTLTPSVSTSTNFTKFRFTYSSPSSYRGAIRELDITEGIIS